MSRAVFEDVHRGLALPRLRQLREAGAPGDIARQAFAETEAPARAAYRAMPWWRRWGFGDRMKLLPPYE